jgi:hypothetical protein
VRGKILVAVLSAGALLSVAPVAKAAAPALSGTFSVAEVVTVSQNVVNEPVGFSPVVSWTLVPGCSPGACATQLTRHHSNGTQTTYTVTPDSSGNFAGSTSYSASCYSTSTGAIIASDAYTDAEKIQITPTASANGVVTSFTGSLSVTGTPNATGIADNCNPSNEVITFTGTLPDVFAALGDSYSSGEGLAPFLPGTDTQGNLCHRSAKAYSQVFAAETNSALRMEFHACSGVTPESSWSVPNPATTNPAELPQRDWLSVDDALVTMTYGGNDLDWPTTLMDCTKVQLGPFHTTVYGNPKACNADLAAAPQKIESMYENLLAVYLDALKGAPNAQIRVLSYPPLFPLQRTSSSGCAILAGFGKQLGVPSTFQLTLASDVVRQFATLEVQANQAIANAVNRANALYAQSSPDRPARLQLVDVTQAFGGLSGHSVDCGDHGRPEPWINAIRVQDAVAKQVASDVIFGRYSRIVHKDLFDSYSLSFHPTIAGQNAMAAALNVSL